MDDFIFTLDFLGFGWITLENLLGLKLDLELCFLGSYRVKIGFVWSKSVFLGSLPRHEGAIGFLYLGALWFIELIFAKSGQEGKENVLFV